MKKCSLAILCCLSLLLLTACPGLADWSYSLPGGYSISRINDHCVVFLGSGEHSATLVENYVCAVSYNENYIGLQRIPADINFIDFGSVDFSTIEYYLLDIANEELYGPFTKEAYLEKCQELSVGEMCAWMNCYRNELRNTESTES